MRTTVRFAATLLAAGTLSLAACGDNAPEAPASPDLSQGPLEFTISPGLVEFGENDLNTSKSVLIGGLIAVGGYPQFGAPQYSTGDRGWFTMTTTPDFSREPLGWRFTFRLNPSAADLDGTVQARIPVNVPAARNNPQMITVRYSRCRILGLGDNGLARLDENDPIWDRSSIYNNDVDPDDLHPYDEYCLTIPAFTTYAVEMIGECSALPGVSHDDVYLYSWYNPTLGSSAGFVDSDDDGGDCNNSVIYIPNNTGESRVVTIRATSWNEIGDAINELENPPVDEAFGNYRILVSESGFTLREAAPAAEKGDKKTAER
jgi:hypothetical protein